MHLGETNSGLEQCLTGSVYKNQSSNRILMSVLCYSLLVISIQTARVNEEQK